MIDESFPPRQYLGVMLSSTFQDLEQHRAKLMNAISGQGLHPVAMEQDAALPAGTVIDSSLAKVRDAAAYVGVISRRYGQVPEDDFASEQHNLAEGRLPSFARSQAGETTSSPRPQASGGRFVVCQPNGLQARVEIIRIHSSYGLGEHTPRHICGLAPAAAVHRAGVRTPRLRKHSGEPEDRSGYLPRCGSRSSTPSMRASRSGLCSANSTCAQSSLGTHQDRPGVVGSA
jgi:hypothetical protein